MNSRCPSCGFEVDDSDPRCPSCYWDFNARRRMPSGPPESEKPPTDAAAPKAAPPLDAKPPAQKAAEPALPEPPRLFGLGLKVLPIIAPSSERPAEPGVGENPFTLPSLPVPETPPPEKPAPLEPTLPALPADVKHELKPAKAAPPEEAPPPEPAREAHPVPREDPPAPASPPAKPASKPAEKSRGGSERERRFSPVMGAAVGGGALGLVSVVAVFIIMRAAPSPPPSTRASGASPFAARPQGETQLVMPAPAPSVVRKPLPPQITPPAPAAVVKAPPPAPVVVKPPPPPATPVPAPLARPAAPPKPAPARPTATFGVPATPRPAAPVATVPAPAARPKGPTWIFEGLVYDVISLQPVFAAHLRFVDAAGETLGQATTSDGGRYRVFLPAGTAGGYALVVSHPDYTDKYIDEIDPPFREVDREQRLLLTESADRNRPWAGDAKKALRRDFVMIPRSPEEP